MLTDNEMQFQTVVSCLAAMFHEKFPFFVALNTADMCLDVASGFI